MRNASGAEQVCVTCDQRMDHRTTCFAEVSDPAYPFAPRRVFCSELCRDEWAFITHGLDST